MKIQNNIDINNKLAKDLSDLIQLVKDGKISLHKASMINSLARTSINATKEGVLMVHHQQIQRDKVAMHQKEINVKKEHIQLQRDKFVK